MKDMNPHDTPIARAAREELARRTARIQAETASPAATTPLAVCRRDSVAIERLVWSICHVALAPLRALSGYVSRQSRRHANGENTPCR